MSSILNFNDCNNISSPSSGRGIISAGKRLTHCHSQKSRLKIPATRKRVYLEPIQWSEFSLWTITTTQLNPRSSQVSAILFPNNGGHGRPADPVPPQPIDHQGPVSGWRLGLARSDGQAPVSTRFLNQALHQPTHFTKSADR